MLQSPWNSSFHVIFGRQNCNFLINRDFTFFSIVSELFNKKIDYCLHFSKKQFVIDYELFTPRIMQCFITNHEEPSFSVSRGTQETEYTLHFSHFMASIRDRVDFIPPFHVLPMPVRAKGRWIFFFFCTHLIKENIRREVGAVTLQKPPSLEGNTFGIQVERIHNLSSWQL